MATDTALAALRAQIDAAGLARREHAELWLDSGLTYADGAPVRITLRKRAFRYDLSDSGAAVRKAGIDRLSRRQREAAALAAASEGMNVSGLGAVFVPAVEGRDIADLAFRLADASRAVHEVLVELADEPT